MTKTSDQMTKSEEPQNPSLVRKYLLEFSSAISNTFIDEHVMNRVVESVCDCKGKVITTGMGKAGLAMRKFSSTLCSTGTPSCYLHPGEATHGDMGLIGNNDLIFVASTSGKTREVVDLIDLIHGVNNNLIIGITSHPDSIIRKKADIVIDMGEVVEAGELGLAPTTSILVIQAITDAIALIVSEKKEFTKNDFGRTHHSGYLGELSKKP